MKNVVSRSQLLSCIRPSIIILLLCNIAISCSDSTGPDDGSSEGQFTISEIGSDGGTMEVTASDGTECRLTIPAGTLSESTNIMITAESSPHESMFTPLSNSFLLEPEGLEFDEPVTIEITVPNALSSDQIPAILHTDTDGNSILLETAVDGQTLSASIEHFSRATPVIPTANELLIFWNNLILEIDEYGVDEWRALLLCTAYLLARAGSNDIYSSIDLDAWKEELRIQTSTLIYVGSLRCATGDHAEAQSLLNTALFIADRMDYTELKTEAQQVLDNCGQTGTILINQAPDNLSGAGWSLTGPRTDNGSGFKVLNDMPCGEYTLTWKDVNGYFTPSNSTQTLNADDSIAFSGVYVQESDTIPPQMYIRISETHGYAEIILNGNVSCYCWNGYKYRYPGFTDWRTKGRVWPGNYTFTFKVKPYERLWADIPSAKFEVKVGEDLQSATTVLSDSLGVPESSTDRTLSRTYTLTY